MLHVERQRTINNAMPDEVFSTLSNPDGLTRLLPRLRKAELSNQGDTSAHLALYISIGSMFGTLRFDGTLQWEEPHEIALSIKNPLPAEVRWNLQPDGHNTDVRVAIRMNLDPLLGPMKHFIPMHIVEDMIKKDLGQALQELATRLESNPEPYVCPMPQLCSLPQAGLAF